MHRVRTRRTSRACALAAAASLAPGCVPRDRAGFDAIGPAHRLDAIVLAADADDPDTLRGLIQQLDSDDAAARLLALRALQHRTGQTLGYRHDDPPWKRAQAVARWVRWHNENANHLTPTSSEPSALHHGPTHQHLRTLRADG